MPRLSLTCESSAGKPYFLRKSRKMPSASVVIGALRGHKMIMNSNGIYTMLWLCLYHEFPIGGSIFARFSDGSSSSSLWAATAVNVCCCCCCCCSCANCVCWLINICNCWLIDTGSWILPRDGIEVRDGILVITVVGALDTGLGIGVSGSPLMMGFPPTPALSIAAFNWAMERTGNCSDDGVDTPGASRLKKIYTIEAEIWNLEIQENLSSAAT